MKEKTEPDALFQEDIEKAAQTVKEGGVILYPTDTIWGIGCDARNPEAVQKIFDIKKRDDSKSLIVLVSSENMLLRYVKDIPEISWDILAYSERPTTIIYDSPIGVARNVLATDGSLGIRIVKDDFCRRLIERIRTPLVSTSANLSGEPSPAFFAEISPEIRQGVDYTVQYRQEDTTPAEASVVIKLTNDSRIKILRR